MIIRAKANVSSDTYDHMVQMLYDAGVTSVEHDDGENGYEDLCNLTLYMDAQHEKNVIRTIKRMKAFFYAYYVLVD